MIQACKYCGGPVPERKGSKKRQFCGHKCAGLFKRGVSYNRLHQHECLTCGKAFVGIATRVYCTTKCRNFGAAPTVEGYAKHLLRRSVRRELTVDMVVRMFRQQGGRCALTGFEMTFDPKGGRESLFNMSIDRIDSSGGYTASNIQLACLFANKMKAHLPMQQFVSWCGAIVDEQARRRARAA